MSKTSRPDDEAMVEQDPTFVDECLAAALDVVDQRGGGKPNAVELRFISSFRQGAPEPRLQGWSELEASMQSGFRRSMPE